jgi:hypothetical protein
MNTDFYLVQIAIFLKNLGKVAKNNDITDSAKLLGPANFPIIADKSAIIFSLLPSPTDNALKALDTSPHIFFY